MNDNHDHPRRVDGRPMLVLVKEAPETVAFLDEWSVSYVNNWLTLRGRVFGHPRTGLDALADGEFVTTSRIIQMSATRAVSQNTVYALGEFAHPTVMGEYRERD